MVLSCVSVVIVVVVVNVVAVVAACVFFCQHCLPHGCRYPLLSCIVLRFCCCCSRCLLLLLFWLLLFVLFLMSIHCLIRVVLPDDAGVEFSFALRDTCFDLFTFAGSTAGFRLLKHMAAFVCAAPLHFVFAFGFYVFANGEGSAATSMVCSGCGLGLLSAGISTRPTVSGGPMGRQSLFVCDAQRRSQSSTLRGLVQQATCLHHVVRTVRSVAGVLASKWLQWSRNTTVAASFGVTAIERYCRRRQHGNCGAQGSRAVPSSCCGHTLCGLYELNRSRSTAFGGTNQSTSNASTSGGADRSTARANINANEGTDRSTSNASNSGGTSGSTSNANTSGGTDRSTPNASGRTNGSTSNTNTSAGTTRQERYYYPGVGESRNHKPSCSLCQVNIVQSKFIWCQNVGCNYQKLCNTSMLST